jgi:hypothetical protein
MGSLPLEALRLLCVTESHGRRILRCKSFDSNVAFVRRASPEGK